MHMEIHWSLISEITDWLMSLIGSEGCLYVMIAETPSVTISHGGMINCSYYLYDLWAYISVH